jgi:histidine kinase
VASGCVSMGELKGEIAENRIKDNPREKAPQGVGGGEDVERLVHEYQDLFELAPCYITVQGRNYRLIRYNREFSENFDAKIGEYCYKAYKGRAEKCPVCPVEKTFQDGRSHWSEESGFDKEGKRKYWVVRTNPIKNSKGETVAAMELCLDITHMKELEEQVKISEQKYHAIFDNIPNPVFVLDAASLVILDCNESVEAVYGYSTGQITGKCFLELFRPEEKEENALSLKKLTFKDQVRHLTKDGRTIYVNIRVSPSKYLGRDALLVTTSDITQRVEMEQQLIQASKMATLGEMATGIAHELNQPLSVIKTSSNFFMRKVNKEEPIEAKILLTMASKISSSVDRATKIISHMREFGRKSFDSREKVDVNRVLRNAQDILSRQLELRGIEVVWALQENLPMILAEPSRLEQVIINLLVNARDAIEDKVENGKGRRGEEKIYIRTSSDSNTVKIEVMDTGLGIPEAVMGKIFEPFFTTKRPGQGTGLGLSISYGIVKDFGGTIQAFSEKQGGARFVIEFPILGDES